MASPDIRRRLTRLRSQLAKSGTRLRFLGSIFQPPPWPTTFRGVNQTDARLRFQGRAFAKIFFVGFANRPNPLPLPCPPCRAFPAFEGSSEDAIAAKTGEGCEAPQHGRSSIAARGKRSEASPHGHSRRKKQRHKKLERIAAQRRAEQTFCSKQRSTTARGGGSSMQRSVNGLAEQIQTCLEYASWRL